MFTMHYIQIQKLLTSPWLLKCFMKLTYFGEQFTSVKSKGNYSPVVTAYWIASLEQNGPNCELSAGVFPHTFSIIMPSNRTVGC